MELPAAIPHRPGIGRSKLAVGTRAGFGIGAILVVAMAATVLVSFRTTYAARSSPAARCTILASRAVLADRGDDRWEAQVSWSSDVAGTHYQLTDANPAAFRVTQDRGEAEAVAARYTAGSNVTCYYDPSAPLTSVLERSPPPTIAIVSAIAAAAALLAGVFMGAVSLARRRRP